MEKEGGDETEQKKKILAPKEVPDGGGVEHAGVVKVDHSPGGR